MEDLKGWWEIPSIAQFVSLFRLTFGLPEMDIEELEEGFLADGTPGGSPLLEELLVSLLRGCIRRGYISGASWEDYLYQLFEKHRIGLNIRNPLSRGRRFSELNLRTKVEIVYALCLLRLDCNVFPAMKSVEAEALRVQSLGCDNLGNVYWYIYGTRLYKEEPPRNAKKAKDWEEEWSEQKQNIQVKKRGRGRPRKKKLIKSDGESEESEEFHATRKEFFTLDSRSRWSVVCSTVQDWQQLATKFSNSKSKCEMSLYKIIKNNFLPALQKVYDEKEQRMKRKVMEISASESPSHSESEELQGNDPHDKPKKRKSSIREASFSPVARNFEGKFRSAGERKMIEHPSSGFPSYIAKASNLNSEKKIADQNISADPELYRKLTEVLTRVKLHKDAWPFLNPVDETIAPGYYDLVQHPVDLSFIERKIHLRAYNSMSQVDDDFNLMVANCLMYNGTKSDYASMAKTLWRVFRKGMKELSDLRENAELEEGEAAKKEKQANAFGKVGGNSLKRTAKTLKNSKRKIGVRGRKHKVRTKSMQGLEMLAEASEQALKEVNDSESDHLSSPSQITATECVGFPGLKVIPLQNHSPSTIAKYSGTSSGDSDASEGGAYSPQSTCFHDHSANSTENVSKATPKKSNVNRPPSPKTVTSTCSPTSTYKKFTPSPIPSVIEHDVTKEAESESRRWYGSDTSDCWLIKESGKVVSPDSRNHISPPRCISGDSCSNDRYSGSDIGSDILKNFRELDDTCRLLGVPTDTAKGDALSNLSALLYRIIKENQDAQVADRQGMSCDENCDLPPSNCTSRPSSHNPSAQYNGSLNGHIASQEFCSDRCPSRQDETPLPPDLTVSNGYSTPHSLNNITTVDASVLGIPTPNTFLEEEERCRITQNTPVLNENCGGFSPCMHEEENNAPGSHDASLDVSYREDKVPEENHKPYQTVCSVASNSHFSHLSEALRDINHEDSMYAETILLQTKSTDPQEGHEEVVQSEMTNPSTPQNSPAANRVTDEVYSRHTSYFPEQASTRNSLANVSTDTSFQNLSPPCTTNNVPSLNSPLPLQLPLSSGMLPLWLSQGQRLPANFPMQENSCPVTLVPPTTQQFLRPLGSLCMDMENNESDLQPAAQVMESVIDKELELQNNEVPAAVKNSNLKSSSPRQPRKRKEKRSVSSDNQNRKVIYVPSVSHMPLQTMIPQPPVAADENESARPVQFIPMQGTLQDRRNIVDAQKESAFMYSGANYMNDVRAPGIVSSSSAVNDQKPATGTTSFYTPYAIGNNNSDSIRLSMMPEYNTFWSGKDIRPLYNISYPHSTTSSMFAQPTVTNSSANMGSFPVINNDPRFPVNAVFYNGMNLPQGKYLLKQNNGSHAINGMVSSRNCGLVPNIADTSAFPPFPVMYAVPNVNPMTLQPSAMKTSVVDTTASLPTEVQSSMAYKASNGEFPPFAMQQRAPLVMNVPSQQIRNHNYLNVPPHVMVTAQSALQPVPSAPFFHKNPVDLSLVPSNATVNESTHLPFGGRALPVYTILPNAATRPQHG